MVRNTDLFVKKSYKNKEIIHYIFKIECIISFFKLGGLVLSKVGSIRNDKKVMFLTILLIL